MIKMVEGSITQKTPNESTTPALNRWLAWIVRGIFFDARGGRPSADAIYPWGAAKARAACGPAWEPSSRHNRRACFLSHQRFLWHRGNRRSFHENVMAMAGRGRRSGGYVEHGAPRQDGNDHARQTARRRTYPRAKSVTDAELPMQRNCIASRQTPEGSASLGWSRKIWPESDVQAFARARYLN